MPVNDVWHPIFSLTEDYHSKNYFFLPPGFNPPPCFFVVVEIAELREIQSSTFTPPPLFFSEIQTSGIFFGWDRDPWYLTSTPFFWPRYRPPVFNTCFFYFGLDVHTSRMRATFPSAKPINIRVMWPNTAGVRRYPPWNYNRLLAG